MRNLEAGEICSEIYTAQKDIGERISHIVLMGIGEPLDNFDEVMRFLENISSPEGVNIGMRNISLSTCGLVPKLDQLAEKKLSNKGEILVSIPADKKLFKELTDGKVVVGDRRTMESIPGGTTLGGRINIILTSDQNYSYGNAKIVHDMDEAMEELKNYVDEDIFVVGGEKVYKEFFPYCERAYITKVDYEYQADAYLENLEESDEWIMTHDSDEWTYYDLEYYFYQYKRR